MDPKNIHPMCKRAKNTTDWTMEGKHRTDKDLWSCAECEPHHFLKDIGEINDATRQNTYRWAHIARE